jgi:hypothetical protein
MIHVKVDCYAPRTCSEKQCQYQLENPWKMIKDTVYWCFCENIVAMVRIVANLIIPKRFVWAA